MRTKLSLMMLACLPLVSFAQDRSPEQKAPSKKIVPTSQVAKSAKIEKQQLEGCLTAIWPQYPEETYVPSCIGQDESITNFASTGEYSMVTLTAGVSYTFSSHKEAVFITISDENGETILASGNTSVDYVPTESGNFRFYLHTNSECGTDNLFYQRKIKCGIIPEEPEYGCNQSYDGLMAYSSSINSVFGTTTANDFFVPKSVESFKINSVKLLLLPMAEDPADFWKFSVQILKDSGFNSPGTEVVQSFTDIEATEITENGRIYFDYVLYDVTLDLGGLELPVDPTKDTRYWISVTSLTHSGENSAFWIAYKRPPNYISAPAFIKEATSNNEWVPVRLNSSLDETYDSIWSMNTTCEDLNTSEANAKIVSFYPNPVKDILTINTHSKVKAVNVFNLAGQRMNVSTELVNNKLDMSKLAAGIYVVKITDASGKTESVKVVKK